MQPASAPARNSTAGATSCGSPDRPSAIRLTNGAGDASSPPTPAVASVRVDAGATAFSRITRAPWSRASDCTRLMTTAFVAL
jgi:hypothetical protein